MSKLPADNTPLRLDPDLAAGLEDLLAPYSGKQLERAQAAILKARARQPVGSFATLIGVYEAAILQAVK